MSNFNSTSSSSYSKILSNNISTPLTQNEEQELFRILHSSTSLATRKAARDRIACANMRFVMKVVNEFQNKSIDMNDLYSEALAAMISAIDTFDPSMGNKFISHAVWSIRGAISAFLNQQESLVHIPANRILERRKVTKLLDSGKCVDEKAVSNAKMSLVKTVSIESPTKVSGESSREPLVASIADSSLSTEAYIDQVEQERICKNLLGSLSTRESHILRGTCGFYGDTENYRTLEKSMNISRERIRQIRNTAIEKLRKKTEDSNIDKHSFYLS